MSPSSVRSLPPLSVGLHLVGLAERREQRLKRCEQRLRLSNLRHFRRRRKAFERRREHGVGVGGTVGG
jgi:hypothetical protein